MKERIVGIDFLKILSMLMVVLLHVLSQGGIMSNTVPFSCKYYLSNFMEISSYCAVNCYALISGYTLFKPKVNYSGIINLWFEVLFYNLLITAIFCIFMPQVIVPRHFILMLGPVSFGNYWYFSAYFAMYFFIPAMNFVIEHMGKADVGKMVMAIFLVLSFLPWASEKGLFAMNNGYSTIWLMALYLVGAYIKKYDIGKEIKLIWPIAGYFLCVIIVAAYKFAASYQNFSRTGELLDGRLWLNYTSPFILFAAVFLLLICLKIDIQADCVKKIIATCSVSSFSVYLLHTHSLIWEHVFPDSFASIDKLPTLYFVPLILLSCVGIYAVSVPIDLVRIKLFKLLTINKLAIFLDEKWSSWFNRIFSKV
ncbi:acyltransferase [Oscillospiraceae bacterium PP1C4]